MKTFSNIVKPQKVSNESTQKKKNPIANNSQTVLPEIKKTNNELNKTQPQPKNPGVSEAEKQKMLNELKVRLNNEMLAVLEEEQNKELERDGLLETCQDMEKKKEMEKKFGIDRAMAQKRIQDLSE